MAGCTVKESIDGQETDISNQENVSRRAGNLGRSSKQQVRHRASIACFSCRDRRIRCVVPKGGSGCIQCKRSGTECVIKMDDERRRPISKAYVSSLSARIAMLESMLQERGITVPPATHPPMTKHEAQSTGSGDDVRISAVDARRHSKLDANSPIRHILSPPYSHDDFAMYESSVENFPRTDTQKEETLPREQSPFHALDLKQEDFMHQIFFPDGGLSCDRVSGRLRYFGPTANCHAYAEPPSRYHQRESPEQVRRAERIIRSVTPKTHDYLMQSFWKHHNSVLQVIDRAAFEADRGSENPKYYSSFLHVTILAVGWRFADKDRCDIARINLGGYESTLHREARSMLDVELEGPMGIPSVQSLLLLGDLECGVGRDNTGWMYSGMANHLAFDIGLHVDCSNIGLSEREITVRRRVMRACFLYDRYWTLFLGRPTSIKRQDLGSDIFGATISPEQNHATMGDTQKVEEEINRQLVELMNFAGQIADSRCDTRASNDEHQFTPWMINQRERNASMDVSALGQQLQDWYGRLPRQLTWSPENIRTAPGSYFLLHEQYHTIIILLHRSREARSLVPEDAPPLKLPMTPKDAVKLLEFSADDQGTNSRGLDALIADDREKSARDVCTQAALQLTQIISQYKDKYDLEATCCTGIQPVGTASIALLAAAAYSKDEEERRIYLSSLETLSDAIRVMSRSYQPASRMENLIQSILAQQHHHTSDPRHGNGGSLTQGAISGAGFRFKNTNLFSFLPVRQEHHNGGHSPRKHEHHHTNSVPATLESAQPPPNPYYQLIPQSTLVPGSESSFPDLPGSSLYPDSLYNSGISEDSIFASRHHSDNYLRVAPSAKGWGLHSLHAAAQPAQPTPVFDSHMPDWIGESANFSSPAALQEPKFSEQNAAMSTDMGSGLDSGDLPVCKSEDTGSLAWMESVASPASPKDFMQTSEKSQLNNEARTSVAPRRNYDLDYLAL